MKFYLKLLVLLVVATFQLSCHIFKGASKNSTGATNKGSSTDSGNKGSQFSDTAKSKSSRLMPYKDVITDKVLTDKGLITVHKTDDKYYFEIPDSILLKDILIVNRISKAATGIRPNDYMQGYAGDLIGESVVQISKGPNNKLFFRQMSFFERSSDSTENGMYQSVANSNIQPIVASFDIKAYNPDSTSIVVDMTAFINGDNNLLFFDKNSKEAYALGGFQADRSYIESIKSFPLNTEIRTVKSYQNGDYFSTYELNSSIVLLPKDLMKPRFYDRRVGYFYRTYQDFDNPKGVRPVELITRWRLKPRDEDIDKYLKGELVEPQKSIIYYIDPATPKKWVPYLIQGVNDWQKAFEKAGFKNAIYALEAPTGDSSWSLEDARHNVIVYKPSPVPNAMGPHIHDPRTGEILETHISWFHNIMTLLHDWYMVQVSPNDVRARKMQFSDSLMGQLIRFVVSHEVGHTLGLMHNFYASSTIPVEKLRDKQWVEENGFCPSIMDYARFNYVAQPEDQISEKGLMPRIGVYDEWAIEWGYRWLPQLETKAEEKEYMNNWITSKVGKDKRLLYGDESGWMWQDPHRNSEDLGDDAAKAGYYGMRNLKRVWKNLPEWSKEANEGYKSLQLMRTRVLQQYMQYLRHVTTSIGGLLYEYSTVEQNSKQYKFLSRERQKAAIQFLHDELFETPQWLLNKNMFDLAGGEGGLNNLLVIQRRYLAEATSYSVLKNLTLFASYQPDKAYTVNELFSDLEQGIWKEFKMHSPIDPYRRNLQKAYVVRLIRLLNGWSSPMVEVVQDNQLFSYNTRYTDVLSIIKGHMRNLISQINNALPAYKDDITRFHLIDVRDQLKEALTLDLDKQKETSSNSNKAGFDFQSDDSLQDYFPWLNKRPIKSCWEGHKN